KYLSLNLFIFFATTLFIDDLNKLRNLLKIIAYMGFGTVIVSIIYIGHSGIGEVSRFSLLGQNPIWFSRELGMSLLATLTLMELTQKKFKKLVFAAFIILMLFFIYITASRGPILGLLIALFFYFFILQGKRLKFFKKTSFALLIILSLALAVAAAPEQIWNRMINPFSGFDPSALSRLRYLEIAKNLFFENPLYGVGTGGFSYFTGLNYPHNIFLEAACELGIGGLLTLIVLIVYTAYLGGRLLRAENNPTLMLSLSKFYFIIFVFSLVNAQFSGSFYGNYELWFSAAGIWALCATKQNWLER
ncbi:MAG: O-antigen ligase family protein, partial [Promethearchaeota archaeon]